MDISIGDLPGELDGFRIIHISDIHGRKLPPSGKVLDEIKRANPQLIALTGDYVSRRASEAANILPFIRALTEIAPVYAVSGNHDYRANWLELASVLRANGVEVLQNEYRSIHFNGASFALAGVSDPFTGHADLSAALPEINDVIVLLAHSPTWFEARNHKVSRAVPIGGKAVEEKLARVALTLSGHTHGGQIKIPLIGALTNASGRLFPRDYIEGLSHEGTGWLYISRGIGYTGLPIRFLSRAQVTVVTLRVAQ